MSRLKDVADERDIRLCAEYLLEDGIVELIEDEFKEELAMDDPSEQLIQLLADWIGEAIVRN